MGDPIKLMRALARIKADDVHIPAFTADSSAIRAASPGQSLSCRRPTTGRANARPMTGSGGRSSIPEMEVI